MNHIQKNIKFYLKGQDSLTLKPTSFMNRIVNKFQEKEQHNTMLCIETSQVISSAALSHKIDYRGQQSEREVMTPKRLAKRSTGSLKL